MAATRIMLISLLLLCACAPAAQAGRIVSLMPSYTEIIYALGAGGDLVGVSSFCNWPPEAAKVEKAGDYLRPNVEKVYSLKPDIVFTGAWAETRPAVEMAALGIKVLRLPLETKVTDIFTTIRLIAAGLGRREKGEKLVAALRAKLPAPQAKRTRVYIDADTGGWTAGGNSYLSDAVALAGGDNIFAGEARAYFQASWEEVLLKDPQAVLVLSGSPEEFLKRPLAGGIAAVKTGRVITAIDRDIFSRPGPRLFGEIGKLARLLK